MKKSREPEMSLKSFFKSDFKSDFKSRKWILVLLVLVIATLGTFIPPIISMWRNQAEPLQVLTGGNFVTIISIVLSAYFGFNVLEKRVCGGGGGGGGGETLEDSENNPIINTTIVNNSSADGNNSDNNENGEA